MINFKSVIEKQKQQWSHVIDSRCDFISFVFPKWRDAVNQIKQNFDHHIQTHPKNSNICKLRYDDLYQLTEVFDYKRWWVTITINLQDDQFDFPFWQFYITKDQIKYSIYWNSFRWSRITWIDPIEILKIHFSKYKQDLKYYYITRYDYCIDFTNTLPKYIVKHVKYYNRKLNNAHKWRIYYKNWVEQTIYIDWSKDYVTHRYYNKTDKINKDWLQDLYHDYDENTIRSEFQFWRDFTHGIDTTQIENKVLSRLSLLENWTWNEKYFVRKRYSKNYITNILKYQQRRNNMTIKLLHNWCTPQELNKYIDNAYKSMHTMTKKNIKY